MESSYFDPNNSLNFSQLDNELPISWPSNQTIESKNQDTNPLASSILVSDSNAVGTWFSTPGEGPTAIGQIYSGVCTAKELVVGMVSPYQYDPSKNLVYKAAQARIANPGSQLGSGDVYAFIEEFINKNKDINTVHSFYTSDCINNLTLEQIKNRLMANDKYFKPNLPIIIPICFSGESLYEIKHITVITIKDNFIEYYDSKGIASDKRNLGGDHTFRDVLRFCRDRYTNQETKKGTILENNVQHQFDIHNCGVFVCRHLCQRFKKLNFETATPPQTLKEIEDFREVILKHCYQLTKV